MSSILISRNKLVLEDNVIKNDTQVEVDGEMVTQTVEEKFGQKISMQPEELSFGDLTQVERHALIDDEGVIVNIVSVDPTLPAEMAYVPPEGLQIVKIESKDYELAEPGGTWSAKNGFTRCDPPPPPVPPTKEQLLAKIEILTAQVNALPN